LNLFELFVKIGVDDQASGKLSKLSSSLGAGLATAAKIGTAAVGAASTAIVALTTQAVNSFAEYEQLAGGAQKIFNDMDFSRIATDANNAYKELGLSANQYLSVINDVGATFAATMGDEAGYEAAKTGLKAISDYASGTGKNVDELSQKFTLITRSTSSYQSIADQFSGILPATSAGFLEQAQAAGILSDSYKTLTEVPIDEYQAAVSQMLEQGVKDLGLYNNTMDEAFSTLSGSLSMAKASWSNLVTGIADEQADIDTLMGNFINSVKAVTKQIAPVVGTALNGIGKLIKEVVPVAMQYIPQIIGEFLPTIGEAAIGIVTSIGTAIFDNIDQILEWGQQMLDTLLDGINSNTGNIASVVSQILTTFGSFILENLPEIIMAGLNILVALVSGIVEAIPELATAATKAIIELAAYLISAENLEKIISLGADLINALSEGIENVVAELVSVGEKVVESIKSGISSAWGGLVSWFNGIWNSLFGDRTVSVSVKTSHSGAGGGFANGLSYVPYDGFPAILHEGERVLTAEENKAYNNGSSGNTSGITIIQNIQTVPQTPVEFAAATEAYFEQARWAFA
jgi:phage-related protein